MPTIFDLKKHARAPRNPCVSGTSVLPKFVTDTALLRINLPSETQQDQLRYSFWAQAKECYKCPLVKICDLKHGQNQVLVNTTFVSEWTIHRNQGVHCNNRVNEYGFGERGQYSLNLTDQKADPCKIEVTKEPIDANLPVLYAALVYAALAAIFVLAVFVKNRFFTSPRQRERNSSDLLDESTTENEAPGNPPERKIVKKRLRFLDAFRGICIAIMIFVNYGGGLYWYFSHSVWNGLTVADLVFPWFMFIMGTSMALSFESLTRKQTPKLEIYSKIIRRTIILFGLGVFIVNHNHSIPKFRVPGVLQRFAIAYFVVGVLRSLTVVPADYIREKQHEAAGWKRYLAPVRDVWQYWVEWVIMLMFLAAYLMFTFLLPVEGCPTGYIGPGGLGVVGKYGNCTGGAAGKIDRWFFGEKHIYQSPTSKYLYNNPGPYDPEGILGSLMSIFVVFLGLQAGQVLLVYDDFKSRAIRFSCWAVVYGLLAGGLCGFSQNGGWIPVNKNLWSPSFVFSLASMGNVLILVLYFIVDAKNWWSGAPFYYVGMNSILIYLGHEIFEAYMPFSWTPVANNHGAHLAMNLWGASLWVIIAFYMHYKKFYISI